MLVRLVSERHVARAKNDGGAPGGFVPGGVGREPHPGALVDHDLAQVGHGAGERFHQVPGFGAAQGGKATVRVPVPIAGLVVALQPGQKALYLPLDGVQALGGEHAAIEGDLATVGDRGTPPRPPSIRPTEYVAGPIPGKGAPARSANSSSTRRMKAAAS